MKKSVIIISVVVLVLVFASFILFTSLTKQEGKAVSAGKPAKKTSFKAEMAFKSGVSKFKQGKLDEAEADLRALVLEYPETDRAAQALLLIGEIYEKQDKLLDARKAYKRVTDNYMNSQFAPQAQERLGKVNIFILFSPYIAEDAKVYQVQPEENLTSIAKKFNMTVELLQKCNGLKDANIRVGKELKVPTGKFSVIVDKSQYTLTLKENEDIFKVYKVSTGKQTTPTPVGDFKIVNKMVDPVWYSPKDGPIPQGDPRNILGTRWMGINKPGYGIHGTTLPDTIGKSMTAGCVRMLNSDVEELYGILPVGTQVTIID